jgi:hypothetical protein
MSPLGVPSTWNLSLTLTDNSLLFPALRISQIRSEISAMPIERVKWSLVWHPTKTFPVEQPKLAPKFSSSLGILWPNKLLEKRIRTYLVQLIPLWLTKFAKHLKIDWRVISGGVHNLWERQRTSKIRLHTLSVSKYRRDLGPRLFVPNPL